MCSLTLKSFSKREYSDIEDMSEWRVRKCVVCGSEVCKEGEVIRLHNFPKEPETIKKWCENFGILPKLFKHSWKICSRHFDPAVFGKAKLHKLAIPTLNLGPQGKLINKPKGLTWSYVKCAAAGCDENGFNKNIKFFTVPKGEEGKAWATCLDLKWKNLIGKTTFVCQKHFDKNDIGQRRLRKGALPYSSNPEGKLIRQSRALTFPYSKCAVPGCKENGSNKNIRFFTVPKGEDGRAWAACLGFKLTKKIMYVCQKHFAEDDIGQKRLRKGALPCSSSAGSISFDEIEYLDVTNVHKEEFWIDEETETAMTLMPVTKTYGQKKHREKDLVLEEFQTCSDIDERRVRYDFQGILSSERCAPKISETEKKDGVTEEIKLLKENEELKTKIIRLEQEKKVWLKTQKTATREAILLKENEELKATIRQLEQEKKGWLRAQETFVRP
uniref:THAP-type domain-containing protein n=1 Tax=Glossina brevipalpis TaxID=37001 RepID=A0A1A9WEY3_9MUSC